VEGRGAPEFHVPIARLVAMMMHQAPLSQPETDHLVRCENCRQDMIEAVRRELGIGDEPANDD
jgi:hypothetical protein